MMRQLYEAAGLGHFPVWKVNLAAGALILGVALSVLKATGIYGMGIAAAALCAAGVLEALKLRDRQRAASLVAALPEVIEALAASVASGQDLGDALVSQADHGPKALRKTLAELASQQSIGIPLEHSLSWLQRDLGVAFGDQLVQLLQVSLRRGGEGLVSNLNRLSEVIRTQGALEAELEAKQGWVTGTAKLGLVAPWLIVWFLSARPEAKAFYASPGGLALLLCGLVLCLVAYALIIAASRLPRSKRVLTDVA
ncbi:MAG: hypothetical protein RLZ69_53 [Actinomycetota bacterium]